MGCFDVEMMNKQDGRNILCLRVLNESHVITVNFGIFIFIFAIFPDFSSFFW